MLHLIDDTLEFIRVLFSPRLAGLLYMRHRIEWRGVVFASAKTNRIVYANKVFLKKTGWTIRDFRSKPFLAFVHPDDHKKTLAEMANLKGENITSGFHNRYLKPDGTYTTVTWTAAIIGGWYICETEFNG